MALTKGSGDGERHDFFDPKAAQGALALLIEVKESGERDFGNGKKLTITADVTRFDSEEQIVKGEAEKKTVLINHTLLAKDLDERIGVGNETVKKVARYDKGNKPFIWRDVDDDIFNRVAAFLEQREAALESELDDFLND